MIYGVRTVLDVKLMPFRMVEMLRNPQTMTQNTSCDTVPRKEFLCTSIQEKKLSIISFQPRI